MPVSAFTGDGGPHANTMKTSKGKTKAAPSALNGAGNAFSVTWAKA
jgi:hypothetical protein